MFLQGLKLRSAEATPSLLFTAGSTLVSRWSGSRNRRCRRFHNSSGFLKRGVIVKGDENQPRNFSAADGDAHACLGVWHGHVRVPWQAQANLGF